MGHVNVSVLWGGWNGPIQVHHALRRSLKCTSNGRAVPWLDSNHPLKLYSSRSRYIAMIAICL